VAERKARPVAGSQERDEARTKMSPEARRANQAKAAMIMTKANDPSEGMGRGTRVASLLRARSGAATRRAKPSQRARCQRIMAPRPKRMERSSCIETALADRGLVRAGEVNAR